MSNNSADELAGSMECLNVAEITELPKRWEDDPENPGAGKERFLEDWIKIQEYYDSLGVPCARVVMDESGRKKFLPRAWAPLKSAGAKGLEHELDTAFFTLTRRGPRSENEEAKPFEVSLYRMVGNDRQEWRFVVVPEKEVESLQTEGWELWSPPEPALDIEKGYRDIRPRIRPVDVTTTDNPAADTERYLGRGNDFVARNWTEGNWKPGDLLGENGSDPATKVQSATYANPDSWNQLSESRVATSTGHVPHHERPAEVGLGWGDYDKFTFWQSSGRQVTKDMVEEKDWSTELNRPITFVDEAGEVVETFNPEIEAKDLPNRSQPPLTLHQVLTGGVKQRQKVSERTLAWPGTFNDSK
ncbi:hypothetical protein K4F52_006801 [Lecanicillium sp. MT-2017a]|nr:hypothetical protein K4F52_006801 [Lecanicillium sp. MT-2017a]